MDIRKQLRLVNFIQRLNFDIALLTETWLTPDIKNSYLRLPDYYIIRTDRPARKGISTHGGVLIAITNEIKDKEVLITCLPKTVQTSLRVIKIETTKPCHLAVFDNPLKRSTYQIPLEEISLMFDFLKTQCPGNLILTGDFNMPETSWETYQSSNDYEETRINFAIDNNQHVNFKTTSSSCLDLVFTSNDTLINSVRTETVDKFSDDHPVEFQLSLNEKTRKTGRVENYSYCKCNFDEMMAEMKSTSFQPYCYSNIDVNTNLWYKWLFGLIDRFTPKEPESDKATLPGFQTKHPII